MSAARRHRGREALGLVQRPLQALARPIPITTVSRTAVEALVVRLTAQGVGHGG